MSTLRIGRRVRLSTEALRQFPRYIIRQGTITGESRDGARWLVQFDRMQSRQAWAKEYIEPVNSGTQNAAEQIEQEQGE